LDPKHAAGRIRTASPFLVALAALAVFALTLQRTLPAGDSGELIAVAWNGGVAHPPGYPLYSLLAGAWARVFAFGEPALRLAVFSALCMAAAAGLLAAALPKLGASSWAAGAAALAWAFCAPAWKMALVAEVFALNSLLAAGLWFALALLIAARTVDEHRRSLFALTGLTVLGLSHHHTLFILALPVDAVALATWWRRGRPGAGPRFAIAMMATAIACLLPLLLLMIPRHGALPVWGETSTWTGLWHHLLRRDYGTFSLEPAGSGAAAPPDHVLLWLSAIPRAFGYLGAVVAVAGLAVLARRRSGWPLLVVAVGALGLQALFFTRVGFALEPAHLRGVVERFQILPAMVVAVAMAFAIGAVGAPRARRRGLSRVMAPVLAALVVAAPLLLHWRAVDQHDNTFHADFVHNLLAGAPDGSVLFVRGDHEHNGLAYATGVLGRRTDLAWADQELLTYPWYVRRLRAREPGLLPPLTAGAEGDRYSGLPASQNIHWLEHLAGARAVAFTEFKDESYARSYTPVPRGLVLVMHPHGEVPPLAAQARDAAELLATMRLDSWFQPQEPWSFELVGRQRIVDYLVTTATLFQQPEAATVRAAEHPGLAVLRGWLARYRAAAAPGDPRLHYASGFLHLIHPDFRDPEAAAADLARLREHAAGDAAAARAAELLAAGLAQARDSGGN
jgi:hypothetical protein